MTNDKAMIMISIKNSNNHYKQKVILIMEIKENMIMVMIKITPKITTIIITAIVMLLVMIVLRGKIMIPLL